MSAETPDDDRLIFEAFGRCYDLQSLWHRFTDDPEVDAIHEGRLVAAGDREAYEKVVAAGMRAFNVKSVDEVGRSGVTEAEVSEAITDLLGEVDRLKKKLSSWPTRWRTSDSATGSGEPQPQPSDSDSPSTETES